MLLGIPFNPAVDFPHQLAIRHLIKSRVIESSREIKTSIKLATSLFVIVLIAIGALLFFAGPPIDRPPNAELCNAAYALVKRQIPDNAVRRKGECLVTGSGALHTVHWAYSTATSREREMPPIAYEVRLAFDGKTYHLCLLSSLERKQEFSHHPLLRQAQGEQALSYAMSKLIRQRSAHSPRIFRQGLRRRTTIGVEHDVAFG